MRLFILQIHNGNGGPDRDELIIREDFESICKDFSNKYKFLKESGLSVKYYEEPTLDDATGEAHGAFIIRTDLTTTVFASIYDYDT